uniref:Transcription repressor n=1 Tax=Cicer arietinum TaxID=3827 RepID=A0A1S2YE06_CICAR|nr:transcription repressor OFP8 isoform X1 [Cicer arietinum]XP_004503438.2 transcription repressor OFP8 isoform X2 [Cicer arietinum]
MNQTLSLSLSLSLSLISLSSVMENQNRLKMRISRMFRSSFASCKTRHLTDVMEKPLFAPSNSNIISFNIPRPKISSFSSSSSSNNNNTIKSPQPLLKPTNLAFYQNSNDSTKNVIIKNNKNKNKKKKKKKKNHTHNKNRAFPFNSCAKDTNFDSYYWLYSSDDEDDETDTLFSSKSHSSDSSKSRRRKSSRRKTDRSSDMGVLPLNGKVKDTFAVVKRSSDPYNDFRTSMVEMIVEKQIFSPTDLENLLQCFLSLNSFHHHKIIVEVFTEIWEALFSDWL